MATYYNPASIFMSRYPSVIGLAFGNGNNAEPTRIDFADGTSNSTEAAVQTAADSFDWVALPQPNVQGFVTAIEGDATLTGVLEILVPFYAAIENYAVDPSVIKTAWAELQTTYSSQLTSAIVTTIEGYATANNMPLV